MKTFKYISILFLFTVFVIGCTQEDDLPDISNISEPTDVSALINVMADNSGTVTITPLGKNVANFKVNFGDGSEASDFLEPGESVQKVYQEGTYQAAITAFGINGKSTTVAQEIIVSFQAPQNLMVTIENDAAVSRRVNVSATAEFAMSYQVNFGDADSTVVESSIDEIATFDYPMAGTYTITVTAFSAAIETVTYTEEFVVTEISQPLSAAPNPAARNDDDVISLFSNAYMNDVDVSSWRSEWSTSTFTDIQIEGNDTKSYVDADFVGVEFYDAAAVDASNMEFFHVDVWTNNATTFRVKLVDLGGEATEAEIVFENLEKDTWVSLEIPMSDFTNAGMQRINAIQQLIFSGLPTGTFDFFIDNVYFYKSPSIPFSLVGTWQMAPEAGSLGVGPALGDVSWFACDDACVTERACYFDDTFEFGADGTFTNVLGAETWIESWQGGGDACGTPVAPYDGSASATYIYDSTAGTVTLNGEGSYIGIPKANNQGELPDVAVPASISYGIEVVDVDTIKVHVEVSAGVFWQYKLVRTAAPESPIVGTWLMASEAGSLGVGPALGDTSWFACDDACVSERACYFDDTFVFGADGTFTNVLGTETWIEAWQGGGDACGTPVAPHNGSASATYVYDSTGGTITLNGEGAYIGIPKANNQGELPDVPLPSTITYAVTLIDDATMNVSIETGAGSGVFWQYKLVKQ